jgi:nitrite reductase/ring-hydroxylating ferredoxin subunit
MAWTTLCDFSELKEGQGKYVDVGNFQLAVFLHEGKVYAIDNECPHAGGNLSSGMIMDGCAVCPWHYWAFKLETGEMHGAPTVKIGSYPTRLQEEGGKQLVQAELPGT